MTKPLYRSIFTDSKGNVVEYCVYGSGEIDNMHPVLFIPGRPAQLMLPKGLEDPGLLVYVMSRPGYGKSSDPQDGASLETYSATLAEFVEKVIGGKVTLVTHSAGSAFGVSFANLYSHLVNLTVLCAPARPNKADDPDASDTWFTRLSYVLAIKPIRWVTNWFFGLMVKTMVRNLDKGYITRLPASDQIILRGQLEEYQQAVNEALLTADGEFRITGMLHDMRLTGSNWWPDVDGLKAPIVVVVGGQDNIVGSQPFVLTTFGNTLNKMLEFASFCDDGHFGSLYSGEHSFVAKVLRWIESSRSWNSRS